MPSWDPDVYLAYAHERQRPGLDLLARIPADDPALVVDLGCGTGELTRALARRWPAAAVAGIDASEAMLERAARADDDARVTWMPGDIAGWRAAERVDVLFSNAALHWIDDHGGLFTRLLGQVGSGGTLAVQMPTNHDGPTHTAIAATVEDGPWADRLRPLLPRPTVWPARRYHDLLRPVVADLDVWETTYWHALDGPDPVLDWTRGSVLRPLLDALGDDERQAFLDAHGRRLRSAYPAGSDGVTLLPFRRLFIVATRG